MRGYRRKGRRFGRPVVFRTWFGVWCEMKGLGIAEMARILMVGPASVERWRAGRPINRHMARLVKAFFPDAPIHGYGGPVALLRDPLPVQARSVEMYKFIFRMGGLISDLAHPDALARARNIGTDFDLRGQSPLKS